MFSRRLAVSRAVRILEARAWTAGSRSDPSVPVLDQQRIDESCVWSRMCRSTNQCRARVEAYFRGVLADERIDGRMRSQPGDHGRAEQRGAVKVIDAMPVIWERRLDRFASVVQCRDVSAEVTSIEYIIRDPSTMLWCSTRGKRKAASPIDWFRTSTRNRSRAFTTMQGVAKSTRGW